MTQEGSAPEELTLAGGRSFYSATVSDFLTEDVNAIVGRLSSRHVAFHASAEATQIRAWEKEIAILRTALRELGPSVGAWSVLLESPLLRLGKRLDAVVLTRGPIGVIEFKIGATGYDSGARVQVEGYAHSLRDFHEVSQSRLIVPILCADQAASQPINLHVFESVADTLLTNASTLVDALAVLKGREQFDAIALDATEFDQSPYRPTPTIIEAAQALYAGHQFAEIGRGDAADAELQSAANVLWSVAADAEAAKGKVICFVTGAPGAGKTLLGLDMALKSRSSQSPAALLSGNRPLVHVLTEALAADSAARNKFSKVEAKYQAVTAIQNLLGYLKEHTDGAAPPEHVIIFDEAQRAWDATVGQELMGRPKSEPELFLDILDRLEWSCLVCLVGPGQEINRGEGGLELWGQSLARAAAAGHAWKIVAAPPALDGGPEVTGPGLLAGAIGSNLEIVREPRLHLANAIRAYRNPLHGQWVAALLEGDLVGAKSSADRMDVPPAYLTRDLETAKSWLRERRRGGRSVGLLASSGAVRLVGDGLPPTPRSNELGPIGHWFLKPYTDFRSSGALETPLSEFGCQGLELDYVGLCWGRDLIWSGKNWVPRMMRAPRWQVIRDVAKKRFRLNGYRVLLTRARAGLVIYVPLGSEDDDTRSPIEADETARVLESAGCQWLSD